MKNKGFWTFQNVACVCMTVVVKLRYMPSGLSPLLTKREDTKSFQFEPCCELETGTYLLCLALWTHKVSHTHTHTHTHYTRAHMVNVTQMRFVCARVYPCVGGCTYEFARCRLPPPKLLHLSLIWRGEPHKHAKIVILVVLWTHIPRRLHSADAMQRTCASAGLWRGLVTAVVRRICTSAGLWRGTVTPPAPNQHKRELALEIRNTSTTTKDPSGLR